jgi:PAS domain S-box-containing protein
LAVAIFLIDLRLPLGVPFSIMYVVVILLGLPNAAPHFAPVAAAGCSILTVADVFLSPGSANWVVTVNRLIVILVQWITAILIAQNKRIEAELRDESRRAQDYLDVAGVILIALDRRHIVTLINRKGCAVLDRLEGEAMGHDWFDTFVPVRLRAAVRAIHDRILEGRRDPLEHFEYPVLTREGLERVIEWHHTVLRDRQGQIVGALLSGDDVTERRIGERALQQSVKDLADVKYALDQSAIVATTDVRGLIKYANDKFCEISKYSREELIGQDHRIINSAFHPKEFMRDLWRTIAAGRIWRGEIRNRAKDGSLYWVDTTIVPFLEASGKPYQYMAIRYDITERKRSEERLREQEALARVGSMAAMVAHEVKNPLAGIRGALQVIGARVGADSRERRVIGDVMARVDSLNQFVQDLLLYARPRTLTPAAVPITGLLRSTVDLLHRDPTFGGIQVRIAGDSLTVAADAELLRIAFQNLMLNAAQAMSGTGTIDVTVRARDGRCEVLVRDAGPGIPSETRDRIFEPFFTTKHRGSGLGLPIARRVVDLHGGDITVTTPADGGTEVRVSLPVTGLDD